MDNINLVEPDEPIFNIGAVTRATGIPITTLHAWERRYGFPVSMRSAGGHRLYSKAIIKQLQEVKNHIDKGMQTHLAINLIRNKSVLEVTQKIQHPIGSSPDKTPQVQIDRINFMNALYQQDIQRADQILGDFLAVYSPEELTMQLIGPALNEIGESWAENKLSITEEHIISNYLRHRLLMWMNSGLRNNSSTPILLACAPGEWHEGSLLMMGVLLRRQGWPVQYLGQNVNLKDLASYIHETTPMAVVLVAMRSETAKEIMEWPNWIQQIGSKPIIAYGGKAFIDEPTLMEKIPGLFLGSSIQEGVDRLNTILNN